MTVPLLTPKFVRYFDHPTSNANSFFGLWQRATYEFWGFCVNGGDNLRHPGGFPTGSTSDIHMSGVINMPAGWESGSNVLIHSGSDGSTVYGTSYVTGSNFTTGHVGMFITLWKSGSSSTDDSIYKITKTYFAPNATTGSVIGVDVLSGGTPVGSGSRRLGFTDRTNVNYRIIDYAPVGAMTYTVHNFIIIVMTGAPYVNEGQRNSQVRFRNATFRDDNFPRGFAMLMSPSGSWNGSQFTEGLTGGTSETVGGGATNIGEFGPHSGNSFDWEDGTTVGTITMIGAGDFLFARSGRGGIDAGFHVEIPQRLYPRDRDPNPIAGMNGRDLMTTAFLTSAGSSYGYGFYMISFNNKPNIHYSFAKHNFGQSWNTNAATSFAGLGNGIYNHVYFNVFTNKYFFSDVVLGTAATAQNSFARARLRRVRFMPVMLPTMHILGDNGEWFHAGGGVLLPWDNSLQPRTIFHAGSF